jgi:hypothetical protein
MKTTAHTAHHGSLRRLAAVAAAIAAAALLRSTGLAYGWPVKPFDRPHPVRGSFGDPRTIFFGLPSAAGLRGDFNCTFHEGVDVSAPNDSPAASRSG